MIIVKSHPVHRNHAYSRDFKFVFFDSVYLILSKHVDTAQITHPIPTTHFYQARHPSTIPPIQEPSHF
jgi:hypothetical protein